MARRAYLRLNKVPQFPAEFRRRHGGIDRRPERVDRLPTGCSALSKLRFYSEPMREVLEQANPWADLQMPLGARQALASAATAASGSPAASRSPDTCSRPKGDRVAMHSSVEVRYPFLDEDVFDFLAPAASPLEAARFPRQTSAASARRALAAADRLLGGTRSSFALRWTASTWTRSRPSSAQLLSEESLRRTGYFDVAAVHHWRRAFRQMRAGSLPRLSVEMGLAAVVATQLWHHLYMGGGLAELPAWTDNGTTVKIQ